MWSELQVLIIQNLRNGVMRLLEIPNTGRAAKPGCDLLLFSGATYIS